MLISDSASTFIVVFIILTNAANLDVSMRKELELRYTRPTGIALMTNNSFYKMELSGKDIIKAIKEEDYGRLDEIFQDKRGDFITALEDLTKPEMEEMWADLSQIALKTVETMQSLNKNCSNKTAMTRCPGIQFIHLAVKLGISTVEKGLEVCQKMLFTVVYLNITLMKIPNSLDSLKDRIVNLCEKMFHSELFQERHRFTYNSVIYLIAKTLKNNSETDIMRIHALRSVIPEIVGMQEVDTVEVIKIFKKCAISRLFLSKPEGRTIITLMLLTDVQEMHNVIKNKWQTTRETRGTIYGKIYYHAWSHAMNKNNTDKAKRLQDCLDNFFVMAIHSRKRLLILDLRKFFSYFYSKIHLSKVYKMLDCVYSRVVSYYITNLDGRIRANTAQLFVDAFPLYSHDMSIAELQTHLVEQTLLIKDLLTDKLPRIRKITILGLCTAMSNHWRVFNEDILETYFRIFVNSSAYDRLAVYEGFKVMLGNPDMLQNLQILFPALNALSMGGNLSDAQKKAFSKKVFQILGKFLKAKRR
ncbi:condensin-2 complex subunit G2, partial [Caerostris extrusa]